MGLLSTEVEVTLQGVNISYYENLGYTIPRVMRWNKLTVPKGTTITVKVEDLPPVSSVHVEVECDCCKKKLSMSYARYNYTNHDGKCYCVKCANGVLHSGENNWNWKPELTDEDREHNRGSVEYVNFIKRVLCRDDYTCKCCGKKINHDAEVHHLDGYDWCIEKRTDDTNGITLCSRCHKAFHNKYGYGGNTKEQFDEWIGYAINNLKKYNGKLPTAKRIYCLEEDKIYNSSKELAELWGLKSITGIHNVCNHKQKSNTVRGKHLFWYDEYTKMDKKILNNYLEKTKNKCFRSVICLNTSEIFESIADAGRKNKYNATAPCIADCCAGRNKSSGRMPDGTAVQWMYYDEYCKLLENKKEIVLNYKEKGIEVICTTTGKIFKNIKLGAKEYNISPTSVSSACKGNFRFAGKLSDGTKLRWMYYADYCKALENQEFNTYDEYNNGKRVICTTTGEIFKCQKMGADKYGIKSPSGIHGVCIGRKKTCGKLPDGTKLKWMCYEDFLKLPQEEQNEILARNQESSNDGSFIM